VNTPLLTCYFPAVWKRDPAQLHNEHWTRGKFETETPYSPRSTTAHACTWLCCLASQRTARQCRTRLAARHSVVKWLTTRDEVSVLRPDFDCLVRTAVYLDCHGRWGSSVILHYWNTVQRTWSQSVLVCMNCLKARWPLNNNRDSSTQRSLPAVYTVLHLSLIMDWNGLILASRSCTSMLELSAKCRNFSSRRNLSLLMTLGKMSVWYSSSVDQYMWIRGLYTNDPHQRT